MIIAIVGGRGMLGNDFRAVAEAAGAKTLVLDLPDFDICKIETIERALPPCDFVLNCAAFTRVDDAEKERDLALAINATGAGNLARVCAARRLPLVHVSTDYVFDGRKGTPYVETDPTAPLNYYGVSKLRGEEAVQAAGGEWTIVRTQSLYGLHGRNFIKAILNQLQQGRRELRVVDDQVSSPTFTVHLAEAIWTLMQKRPRGFVNIASGGHCSWHAFACAIVEEVGVQAAVLPRSTAELNYPALRPAFSVLDTARFTQLTGRRMPDWRQGLRDYLKLEPLARGLA